MAIHPHLRGRYPVLDQVGPSTTPEEFAGILAEFEVDPAPWAGVPAGLGLSDRIVDGPDGAAVPVRIYGGERRAAGVVVWMHGGAFRAGDLDMNESHMVAAELSRAAGVAVVAVGYRLALDGVRFPAPLDDVVAAWNWARDVLAPDAAVRLIGGASAGATLAVGAALRDRDVGRPGAADALLLAYPFLHHPVPLPSPALAQELDAELLPALRVTPDVFESVVRNYVGRSDVVPAEAIPGETNLAGLPRSCVVVAEYDDLRPSGELFVDEQVRAGGVAELHVAASMAHGFLNRSPWFTEVGRTVALFAATIDECRTAAERVGVRTGAEEG